MPLKNLSSFFGKKVLLLTHAGCDVDALSSAAAIHFSLKGKSKTSIGVPDHLNSSAAAFAKNLAIPFAINPPLGSFDVLVCIDFSKPSMLGSMGEAFSSFAGEKFLIDHHSHEIDRGKSDEPSGIFSIKLPTAVPAKSPAKAGSRKGRWQGQVRNPVTRRKPSLIPLIPFATGRPCLATPSAI